MPKIVIRRCNSWVLWSESSFYINEPAHEIMVLITQATSEGSGESAHVRSLARAVACSHTRRMEVDKWSDQKSDIQPHGMAAHTCLKNEFTEDEKCHNLMAQIRRRVSANCDNKTDGLHSQLTMLISVASPFL